MAYKIAMGAGESSRTYFAFRIDAWDADAMPWRLPLRAVRVADLVGCVSAVDKTSTISIM
jgi:hypothetical protein